MLQMFIISTNLRARDQLKERPHLYRKIGVDRNNEGASHNIYLQPWQFQILPTKLLQLCWISTRTYSEQDKALETLAIASSTRLTS